MAENSSKRVFHADIFAEDNDKWSWSAPSVNTKNPIGIPNYAALRKATKDETSSSSSSENESAFRSDSNSNKRSFRKRSSSNSEGNPLEDASSSPRRSSAMSHESVLPPSMYDDDARSASPSTYEKKDLRFTASFHKEFHPMTPRSRDASPFLSFESKSDKPKEQEKELLRKNSTDASPSESPPRRSRAEPSGSRSKKSRSSSRGKRNSRRSRSRSPSKGRQTKSPVKERQRSRSRDRHSDKDRRHHSRSQNKRSCSRDSRSRSKRSRSRDSKPRSKRSHSRDSRRKSRSRSRDRRRSRSRDYRSRSKSYDRHHHSRYRSSSRDRYRRKRYSRSRSHSRDRSKGRSGGAMTPQMALQQTMAAMNAKAQALTGIALPKYYNPAAVNPLKYAEQVQKRKLLWQSTEKVEEQPKSSVWDKLTFAQDQDGKMTAKFRKLMGIKSENAAKEPQDEDKESVLKKQEELFRDLDQQYEMARMTTHTQRGVGLGYSAQTLYPPVPK